MNTVSYFEIHAEYPERAKDFYGPVFNWSFQKIPMPIDYYQIDGAGINGALLGIPAAIKKAQGGSNAFVCSIRVENFDASSKKIIAGGGQVAMEKFAIPNKCWQGYFIDPEGNTFGIFEVDEAAA